MKAWPRRTLRRAYPRPPNHEYRTGRQPARFSSSVARNDVSSILEQPQRLENQTVKVNGWIRSIRAQKQRAFAAVGDGSTLESLQAVVRSEQIKDLSTGSAVTLEGRWVRCPSGTKQPYELQADIVKALGNNDTEPILQTYPIQKKYHTPEFLRTLPHLRARTPQNALVLRLRSLMIATATRFFAEKGFIQTHTPIITSSDCEGAGEVFTVDHEKGPDHSSQHAPFFQSPKYLTVSAQLHLEALAQSVGRVWTLSPTFRAEKSSTSRHLSEFYMLEAEVSFVESLHDVMDVVEELVRCWAKEIFGSKIGAELLSGNFSSEGDMDRIRVEKRLSSLTRPSWPRITYHQAALKLREAEAEGRVTFSSPLDPASGFQTEHEKFLAEDIGHDGPVFVTDYPKAIKPFYMAPSTGKAEKLGSQPAVACFDLLMPDICEVAGGSMREHRLDALEFAMEEKGVKRSGGALDWYLDLRQYGSVPHGGFGLGFDRILAYMVGVSNIRDAVTFPRWHMHCNC
ncbi:MAG: asparaginyl-tRNA synthetase [Alyxoria varia]|nr:MAG: asparaginyl-tRNA synthetase [Alyxoria varia]